MTSTPLYRVCCVSAMVLCLAAAPSTQPADNDLRGTADAAPHNDRARRGSLMALADGLEAYLAGRYAQAERVFRHAMQSPRTTALADAHLLRPLDTIFATCRTDRTADACPICGGTGWADCRPCSASGRRTCRSCGGLGLRLHTSRSVSVKKRPRRTGRIQYHTCTRCQGTGDVVCMRCGGLGVVKCGRCNGPTDRALGTPIVGPNQLAAIKHTITLARRLHAGAVDLYTPDALKPAPKRP